VTVFHAVEVMLTECEWKWNRFLVLGAVDSFLGMRGVLVFLHGVYTCDRVTSCLRTDYIVKVEFWKYKW